MTEPEQRHSESDRPDVAPSWRAGLGVGLLFVVLLAYYVIHKPLGPDAALALAADGVHLAVPLLIMLAGGALGARLLPEPPGGGLSGAAVQAALGLGVFGIAWLPVGASLGVGPWQAAAVLGLTLIVLRRSAAAWASNLKQGLEALRPAGAFEAFLAAAAGLLIGMALIEALGPPLHFDALVYHLSLPAQFLADGKVVFIPGNPFWGNPLLVEMLSTWAMAIGGAPSAAVLGLLVGGLAVAGTLAFVRRYWPAGAWPAAASLLAGETLWSSLGWAYVDWPAALFGLGVLVCLDAFRSDGRLRWAVSAGVMAGFAMGTKYTAAVVAVSALAVLALSWRRRSFFKPAAALLGAAAVAFVAWPMKNLLATGAPLYPFLGGAPWILPLQQLFFAGTHSAGFQPAGPFVPAFATVYGVEGGSGYAASIGPLLLGLGLAGLLAPLHREEPSGPLAVFVAAGWLVWGAAGFASELLSQSRLYFSIFPAWAALAGMGFDRLRPVRWGGVRLGRLAQALIGLVIGLTVLSGLIAVSRHRPLAVLVGSESADSVVTRRLGAYLPAMRAVQQLEDPASVLMLWEPRGLDCQPVCLPDPWIDRWFTLRRTVGDNQAILEAWRAQGVRYLLVNRAGMAFIRASDERYSSEDWSALDELLAGLPMIGTFGDGYTLYTLNK